MKCPSLNELPPPPPGKTGWPWTEESHQLQENWHDGSPWPRISIITPGLNQVQFIEETIRSVLLQGYPDLEYIIIDGGSSDGSIETIRKYEKWLTYWISEPDCGQSHALKKGFSKTTGDVLGWLNADDIYIENSFSKICNAYQMNRENIIAGNVVNFEEETNKGVIVRQSNITLENMVKFWERKHSWHQPGIFFPRVIYEKVGGIDETLHFFMDHDLFCRLLQFCKVFYIEDNVASFRLHGGSKTCSIGDDMLHELGTVSKRYWPLIDSINVVEANKHIGEMYAWSILDHFHRRQIMRSLRILQKAIRFYPKEVMYALLDKFQKRYLSSH